MNSFDVYTDKGEKAGRVTPVRRVRVDHKSGKFSIEVKYVYYHYS